MVLNILSWPAAFCRLDMLRRKGLRAVKNGKATVGCNRARQRKCMKNSEAYVRISGLEGENSLLLTDTMFYPSVTLSYILLLFREDVASALV